MNKIAIKQGTDILGSIDQQVDFGDDGKLPVAGGKATVEPTNRVGKKFRRAFKSQDWHPADHGSFASQHGVAPFTMIKLGGLDQVAWTDHCVQGTEGAEFLPGLDLPNTVLVVRKGMNRMIDSYSAFFENDGTTPTGLNGALAELGIKRIFLTGLARNFCVAFTALDAIRLGYEVFIFEDAVASIQDGSDEAMTEKLLAAGVKLITTADIEGI
jgi:nicotinamidase-related amidase